MTGLSTRFFFYIFFSALHLHFLLSVSAACLVSVPFFLWAMRVRRCLLMVVEAVSTREFTTRAATA